MSAFFVMEGVIADAVQCMNEAGIVRDGLARDLWRMNAEALVQRYRDSMEDYEADIAAYSAPVPANDPYQVLKSTNCLLYQCAEGNVPETALYRELKAAAIALQEKLGGKERVNRSDRYSEAKWDRAA